jgi:4-aminobutyrate aminotransferase-like enzyme
MRGVFTDILGRGVLVMPSGTSLRINPPLVISEEEAAAGLDVIEAVLAGTRV